MGSGTAQDGESGKGTLESWGALVGSGKWLAVLVWN